MRDRVIKRVGVIGYPIKHSLSPVFQQAAFDFHAISARYEAWEVPPDQLIEMVARLREPEFLGANVTVPHKERVIPLLDEIDRLAARVGAVNTIVNRQGRLVGFNTDVEGFLNALRHEASYSPVDKRALLLGAGGAARAVAYALLEGKVASIAIANRSVDRAERLILDLREHIDDVGSAPSLRALRGSAGELAEVVASVDLVINATSVGMLHGEFEKDLPMPGSLLRSSFLVYDLVYNPPLTPLLRAAAERGAAVLPGLPMLIYQGAAAFKLWTGMDAPAGLMLARAQEKLLSS